MNHPNKGLGFQTLPRPFNALRNPHRRHPTSEARQRHAVRETCSFKELGRQAPVRRWVSCKADSIPHPWNYLIVFMHGTGSAERRPRLGGVLKLGVPWLSKTGPFNVPAEWLCHLSTSPPQGSLLTPSLVAFEVFPPFPLKRADCMIGHATTPNMLVSGQNRSVFDLFRSNVTVHTCPVTESNRSYYWHCRR